MQPSVIKVMVVDEQSLYRCGVVQSLARYTDMAVAGQSVPYEALHDATLTRPDVVLFGFDPKPIIGLWTRHAHAAELREQSIEAAGQGLAVPRLLRQQLPVAQIIVLTSAVEDDYLLLAAESGVSAYLPRSVSAEVLSDYIRRVYAGHRPIQELLLSRPLVVSRVVSKYVDLLSLFMGRRRPKITMLTDRELELLHYVSIGKTNSAIAQCMNVSVQTVKNQLSTVFRKLSVRGRTEAALYAANHGLLHISVSRSTVTLRDLRRAASPDRSAMAAISAR